MLKAAICDDEPAFLEEFREKLGSCAAEFHIDVHLTAYDNGQSLIEDLPKYDAVFLDIDMPQMNGLDIAEYMEQNENVMLIFVTAHDELVYSSLKFSPFRFIRKTYLDAELPEAIKSLAKVLQLKAAKQKYSFATKNGNVILPLSSVSYIEIFDHQTVVHLDSGKSINGFGSLSQFEKDLESAAFIRVHRSYLVNCKYIYLINRTCVILDNRESVPLSRYKADEVNKKFQKYLRSGL